MRLSELIAVGIVEDEIEALDMFPIEVLEDFGGDVLTGEPLGGPEYDTMNCSLGELYQPALMRSRL